MKAKSLIISLILIVCFAGIGIGLYCAWPAITGTITDSKYYTSEDLQDAYDKGFDDAFKNKDELTQQVDYYKELTDTYYISILDYQAQIKDYETLTENNKNIISTLEQNKTELIQQVENLEKLSDQLQMTNEMNMELISSLNSQISSLNDKISDMTLQNQNASNHITELNNKISKLQESINYYEQYIASLENGDQAVVTFEFDGAVYNIQIVNKNSIVTVTTPTSTDHVIFNYWTVDGEQVDLSTYQITKNTKFVADITYKYDVKFMVDNQEISSQLIEEGQFATVPENTEKEGYTFDGWSLDGVNIAENIESTPVTQNVTYQALYSKVFKVEFVYNEETISTQQIKSGELAKNVSFAVADNEIFNGWTVDEILVDIESYRITADTIFVASISHKFEVKFMVDDEVVDSQFVIENNFASLPEEPTKSGVEFKGWSLNGEDIIDISKTVITEDTTFIAVFTKFYKFEPIEFTGEASLLSDYIWNDGENVYYSNNDSQFVLDQETNIWTKKQWKGLENFSSWFIWSDGVDFYYSYDRENYVLNKSAGAWIKKTWNGLTDINGRDVWSDGINIYCEGEIGSYYVLNRETDTWVRKVWSGISSLSFADLWFADGYVYCSSWGNYYKLNVLEDRWEKINMVEPCSNFDCSNIWNDGPDAYFGSYKFNSSTNTWDEITWNGIVIDGLSPEDISNLIGFYIWHNANGDMFLNLSFMGCGEYVYNRDLQIWQSVNFKGPFTFSSSKIWSASNNIYISAGETQLVLDKESYTFVDKVWNGYSFLEAEYIWSFQGQTYYMNSSNYYVLDESSSTWILLHSNGLPLVNSKYIWTDGENVYYSYQEKQYLLNKETMIWTQTSDYDSNIIFGNCIWTDGENVYYSYQEKQYILNTETKTCETIVWEGLDCFNGENVWTDGENVYYSCGYDQHVLNIETKTWKTIVWEGLDCFNGENVLNDGSNIYVLDGINQYILL